MNTVFNVAGGGLTDEQAAFAAALTARYRDHVEAIRIGDVDALVKDFFTPDAIWVGAGWSKCIGTDDLRKRFAAVSGRHQVTVKSLYTYAGGDSGWDMADYHVFPNDKSVAPWNFRTAFLWVRDKAEWRCNGVICYTTGLNEPL